MIRLRRAGQRPLLFLVFCLLVLVSGACDGDTSRAPASSPTAIPSPTAAPSPTPPPTIRLLFTGDIIPVRCTLARLREVGSYDAAFDALRPGLVAADVTIGTLDTSLSAASRPFGCTPTFNLAGPPEFAPVLARAGFDVVAHASNHAKDCGGIECGDRAMLDTIENLRAAGVASTGSGVNAIAARMPAIIERGGVRFAFLAYDDIAAWYHATGELPGIAPLEATTLTADIAAARAVADVVVVLPNWGVEYTADPTPRQREFARIAAAAGAHLVVGNHPHWVQAHEQVGGTFVAYALGNFVFDQDWSVATQQGALLEVTFTGGSISGTRYIPIRIHDEYQPRLASQEEAAEIMQRIDAASAALR